jgi:hypothetical protein
MAYLAALPTLAKRSFSLTVPYCLRGAYLGVSVGDRVCGNAIERHERLRRQLQFGSGEILSQMRNRRSSWDEQDVCGPVQEPRKRHLHGSYFETFRDAGQGGRLQRGKAAKRKERQRTVSLLPRVLYYPGFFITLGDAWCRRHYVRSSTSSRHRRPTAPDLGAAATFSNG